MIDLYYDSPIRGPVLKGIHAATMKQFNKIVIALNNYNKLGLNNRMKALKSICESEDSLTALCSAFKKLYPHWVCLENNGDCEKSFLEWIILRLSISLHHSNGWNQYSSPLRSSTPEIMSDTVSMIDYRNVLPEGDIPQWPGSDKVREVKEGDVVIWSQEIEEKVEKKIKKEEKQFHRKTILGGKKRGRKPLNIRCIIHPNNKGRAKDNLCINCSRKLKRLGLEGYPITLDIVELLKQRKRRNAPVVFCVNHRDRLVYKYDLCHECMDNIKRTEKLIRQDIKKLDELELNEDERKALGFVRSKETRRRRGKGKLLELFDYGFTPL
jgi:hypothetical protein